MPLFSIIIATYNSTSNLEKTLKTIINQTFKNFELIIIDGGSKDGTLKIIEKYKEHITLCISEPDKGISDAFNKGITHSRGDYINFQGDGDGFVNKHVLELVSNSIDNQKLLCGSVIRRYITGEHIYTAKPSQFPKLSLLFKMSLPHQGLFIHKDLFSKFGLYSERLKYSMDYEHLLRMFNDFPKVGVLPFPVAYWTKDGVGEGNLSAVYSEYNLIKQQNLHFHKLIFVLLDYFIKFKYLLKRALRWKSRD